MKETEGKFDPLVEVVIWGALGAVAGAFFALWNGRNVSYGAAIGALVGATIGIGLCLWRSLAQRLAEKRPLIDFQKIRQDFLESAETVFATLITVVTAPLVGLLPLLQDFLYRRGVLPFGDVVDGLVATSLAGLASLASGPTLFTRLYWLVEHEGTMKIERGFFHDHATTDAGIDIGQGDTHKEFFRERRKVIWGWFGVHLLYLLVYLFWAFRKGGVLAVTLEYVFVGYVFSVLMVSGCFVLIMTLRETLVKIPQLEFKTRCKEYFGVFCVAFWIILLGKVLLDP